MVYLLWVWSSELGIEKYVDSVWEDLNDLHEYVTACFAGSLFSVMEEEKLLYKHI